MKPITVETTIKLEPGSDQWLRNLLWPVFPPRNDIKITLKGGGELEAVNREYVDALEWDANRETD